MTDAELAPFERLALLVRYRDACAERAGARRGDFIIQGFSGLDAAVMAARDKAQVAGVTQTELQTAYRRGEKGGGKSLTTTGWRSATRRSVETR